MTGGSVEAPRVSVIITTRNRASMLRETLDSVFALDRSSFDLEVVVVDDGSTDDTPAVLADFDVEIVTTSGGIGVGNARAEGMKAATGDFFQMLDDDDVLLPGAIAAQLAEFDRHPEHGAVHARLRLTYPDLTPYEGVDPVPAPGLRSGWILEDLLAYWPQVGTVLTRAEVAREVGYVKGWTGDSEWDFFLQSAARHTVGRIDDVVMLFRQRTDHAEEEMSWARGRSTNGIWRAAIAHLPPRRRIATLPILLRVRGWHASQFVIFTRLNWSNGERRRALRSFWYALRWSPPHAVINLFGSRG
ncbi:MAG: glycosyltransferase family 2 protein [Actinomycetota bacterium]